MSDVRKNINCVYCDAHFHIKYSDELKPLFCAFCGETFDSLLSEEDDDGDLDYSDTERQEIDSFN